MPKEMSEGFKSNLVGMQKDSRGAFSASAGRFINRGDNGFLPPV
jgi:hypothetical protein